jgi:hypothetical protein
MSPSDSNKKYDELTEGYEYPVSIFTLDAEDVAAYLKAVNDADFADPKTLVPPLAVAARALSELSHATISPPGTVHSHQELEFKKAISVGERLKMVARVEKRLDRGELHTLTTGFSIFNPGQEIVVTGRITVACRTIEARWLHSCIIKPSQITGPTALSQSDRKSQNMPIESK